MSRALRIAAPWLAALACVAPAGGQTFDGAFESGNLLSAAPTGPDAYDVEIRPDQLGGQKQWFYFSVADAAGRTLAITIRDFDISAPWLAGMTPCVTADPGDPAAWSRVPPADVSFAAGDLTFAWTFASDDPVWFAYSFVYDHARATALADSIEASPFATRRNLADSLLGRRVDLLEITQGARPDKLGVWVQARQHPAECGSSWTCEGLLEWLVSDAPAARALREHAVVTVVPMLNPDGVAIGHYRTNFLGLDLNREWVSLDANHAPTVWAAHAEITAFHAAVGLDFFLDLHDHSSELANFVFGVDGDAAFDAAEQGWAQELEALHPDFSFTDSSFSNGSADVAKNRIHQDVPRALSYTLEETYHAPTHGPDAGVPMTVARYRAMGRAIGEALVSFWDLCPSVEAYGSGKPNSLGSTPALAHTGTPSLATDDLVITVSGAVPGKVGLFFHGPGRQAKPFHGGTLLVAPPRERTPRVTLDGAGAAALAVPITPGMVGTTRDYQFWHRDPAHPDGTGIGLSDALEVPFRP